MWTRYALAICARWCSNHRVFHPESIYKQSATALQVWALAHPRILAVGCDGPKGVGPDREAEVEVGGWVPAGHGTHGADALAQGNFTKET